MSRRYKGGVTSATAPVPTGPYQCGTANGIWTLPQQMQSTAAGTWPTAGNSAPGTIAIFALGTISCLPSTTRNKYTYSGCVSAAATASSIVSKSGAAVGNSTRGILR